MRRLARSTTRLGWAVALLALPLAAGGEEPPEPAPPAAAETAGVDDFDPCEVGTRIGRMSPCLAGEECAAAREWERHFGPPRLLPGGPQPPPAAAGAAADERISLSLRDADLVEVLRSFARLFDFNLIVDPGVSGKVTVELHDVPWRQALAKILDSHGLAVEGAPGAARIRPRFYDRLSTPCLAAADPPGGR